MHAYPAGNQAAYSHGGYNEKLNQHGWCVGDSSDQPEPLGQLEHNAWGLHDIHGNLFEWSLDTYEAYPCVEVSPLTELGFKVIRGRAYYCPKNILHPTWRAVPQKPDYRWVMAGFRVVPSTPI